MTVKIKNIDAASAFAAENTYAKSLFTDASYKRRPDGTNDAAIDDINRHRVCPSMVVMPVKRI
tara:strand:- start:1920 stop:2108 length:189 start_codon:yes stop_codon:yes gene_type:complete